MPPPPERGLNVGCRGHPCYRGSVVAHLETTDRPTAPATADAAFDAAYDAVINAAGVHVLDGRIVVRVLGDDRASFFHGMCTADVKGARPGSILPALFLTEHAHAIADAFIWVTSDALLLDIDSDAWTRTRAHLERLLVADDVEFEDASQLALIDVEGPAALDAACSAEMAASPAPLALHRSRQVADRQPASLRRTRCICNCFARFD